MPEAFAEVLLRVFARDPRFVAVIQLGFRQVLKDIGESENVEDLDLEASDPENEPATPRPAKRTLSRVTSKKFAPDAANDPPVSLWGSNNFTDVPRGRDSSPSGKRYKRAVVEGAGSPPRKRGKVSE